MRNHSFFSFFHSFHFSFHSLFLMAIGTFILFILAFLLLTGCKSLSKEPASLEQEITLPYMIDIERNIDNVKELPVSLIANEIEYVPLETIKNFLLKKIDKLSFTDSFIFVSDFNKLLQFNRKGKFIRQIGKSGKGPGEYLYVMAFSINEQKSRIYIRDYTSEMDVFDFNGKYIESFPVNHPIFPILCFDNDKIAGSIPNGPKSADPIEYNLVIYSDNGAVLKEFKNHQKRNSKQGVAFTVYPLYVFDGKLRYKDYGSDTSFTVRGDSLEPYAIFNLGQMKMELDPDYSKGNPKQLMEELKKKVWISNIKENSKYLFVNFNYGLTDSTLFCAYEKQTSQIVSLKGNGFKSSDNLFFWPRYIYQDSIMVDYMEASDLMEKLSSTDKKSSNPELSQLASRIKEEDNPILIIAKP